MSQASATVSIFWCAYTQGEMLRCNAAEQTNRFKTVYPLLGLCLENAASPPGS